MMDLTLGTLFPKKQLTAEHREASYWSAGADVNQSFRDATATELEGAARRSWGTLQHGTLAVHQPAFEIVIDVMAIRADHASCHQHSRKCCMPHSGSSWVI